MIKLNGMLMIGSAGSNVGKTELACAIIRKVSKDHPVTAIKVTPVEAKDGQCPRGGKGCGVCSSMEADYVITEEHETNSNKDTAKLLASGAERVFWLRVMKTHLKEGLAALIEKIGPDAVMVCESNSLRQVVEPAVFLIVTRPDNRQWKRSARDVKKYADKIVISDGKSFNFDIGRLKIIDGKWMISEKATAVILAGGESMRMGADKALIAINGEPMIEIIIGQLRGLFQQILISGGDVEKLAYLTLPIIPDKIAGQGPLMAIASALEASDNELNFVIACDIPQIDPGFVKKMLAEAQTADIVIPTAEGQKLEPLFGVYRRSCLEAINEVLRTGRRKISYVFAECKVKYLKLEDIKITNLNTIEEYEQFKKSYKS